MRSTPSLLLFALAFACQPLAMATDDDPAHVAQTFYDGYLKVLNTNGDARRYVLKSDHLTPSLKKAYTAAMKDPDHDPIIQAQDFPKAGFQASASTLKANTATVTLTSRDASFAHSFKATLVKNAAIWLISGIGDLKGEVRNLTLGIYTQANH